MKMACLLTLVLAASATAEEIPLKEIWSTDMPGTRNIRELEPRTEGDQRGAGPLALAILRLLREDSRGWGSNEAGPGFPVPGTGIAALNAAYDVLVVRGFREKRPTDVPAGEVSIIFFARNSGQWCRVEKVVKDANVVTVKYRFVVRNRGVAGAHFALIPLGELSPGKYEVRMEQLKVARPSPAGVEYTSPLPDQHVRPVVSQSFSFEVW